MARTSAGAPSQPAEQLERVERAVADFSRGQFVIVFDEESRENEGDLMIAAEHTDHKAMAHMLARTAGVVCAALPFDRCAELDLPQMVTANSGLHGTAFTVSVDLRQGATTGIPAPERGPHDQGTRRPWFPSRRPSPPGSCLPDPGCPRRRPRTRRAHGSRGRPVPAGGAVRRDRHLRDRPARRDHGPV